MKRLLGALLAALAAGAAWAQNTNDPRDPGGPQAPQPQLKSDLELDQEWRSDAAGGPLKLPAWPKDRDLIEFHISNAAGFRYFVDAASLSVSGDLVVRYTFVARSRSGFANISYEGMRCGGAGLVRIYAYGQDGRWNVRRSQWHDIEPRSRQPWHNELRSRFFCPMGGSIHSVAEGLDALRRDGHPDAEVRFER